MNWYYAKNGAQEGPVTTEALRAKIDSGEVAPTDLAWREGLADWLPVSKIPEFSRQDLPPAVPGVPAAPPYGQATAAPYTPPVAPAAPSYQQPYNPAGLPVSRSSGMAIGAMIAGIIGLLICCAPYVQVPLALVAIILGHIAASKAKKDPARFGGRGMAITGFILGYLALVIGLVIGIYTLKIANDTKSMTDAQREEYISEGKFLPESYREQYRRQFQEQMKAQREKQQQLENAPKENP